MTCAPPFNNNKDRGSNKNTSTTIMLPTKLQILSKNEKQQQQQQQQQQQDEPQLMGLETARFRVQLPTAISAMAEMRGGALGPSYVPRPHDVKCGRGKGSYNRPGNIQFRNLIERFRAPYLTKRTTVEKTALLNQIVDEYQDAYGGRFIKKEAGQWVELSREEVRAKVGHAMRQVIHAFDKIKESSSSLSTANKKETTNIPNHKASSGFPLSPFASGKIKTTTATANSDHQVVVPAAAKPTTLLVQHQNHHHPHHHQQHHHQAAALPEAPKMSRLMEEESLEAHDSSSSSSSNKQPAAEEQQQPKMSRFEELVAQIVQQRAKNPLYVLPRRAALTNHEQHMMDE